MGFYLAVWQADVAPTPNEALSYYQKLGEERAVSKWQPNVEAFYGDLCGRYPEIHSLDEEALDQSPWACAHDKSDGYLIMCLNDGDHLAETATFVFQLAANHGLVCFDPQGLTLSLPPGMPQRKSRFRFW